MAIASPSSRWRCAGRSDRANACPDRSRRDFAAARVSRGDRRIGFCRLRDWCKGSTACTHRPPI